MERNIYSNKIKSNLKVKVMIKKAYVNPETKVTVIECQAILAGSGGSGLITSNKEELGGTLNGDDSGELASKGSFFTFWDED